MFEFGSGTVWITPVGGNLPSDPTPIEIGTLQDVSIDISFDLKMLYGMNQFPEAIARGKGKITGKAKFGRFNSDLINQMMFAQTRTVGTEAAAKDEAHTLGGTVWITPVGGNLPSDPTPIEIGTLQDVSIDISFDLKMLYGMNQFPEAIARGKGKITGKAKFGRFNSDLINQMMFAQTRTVGTEAAAKDEAHTLTGTVKGAITVVVIGAAAGLGFVAGDLLAVAGGNGGVLSVATIGGGGAIATLTIVTPGFGYVAGSEYMEVLTGIGTGSPNVTLTVAAGGAPAAVVVNYATQYLLDLGVRYGATGIPLISLPSGTPAMGQYVNTAGSYQFAAEDALQVMDISYLRTVVGVGVTQKISNQLMGYQPVVTITFRTTFLGQEAIIILYAGVIGKLNLASKLDDFTIPEVDFECFANSAGKVLDIYAAE